MSAADTNTRPDAADLPPYDLERIRGEAYPERIRLICRTWAAQINAAPLPIYAAYVFKIAVFYVGGWCFFCSFTPGLGSPWSIPSWAIATIAFQKAVLWSLFYEASGFGCSVGPLTGRFVPPMGGFLHFLRPGTTKLPLFPGLPIFGGTRRGWLDVGLYAANQGFLLRALVAPEITPDMLLPNVILIAVLAVTDKTIFLAARSEHYWTALVVLAFASAGGVWISGCMLVWFAIWFWAATSKLNHHFPSVIAVMLTNSPFTPAWLSERLFVDYPDDLRPSKLAHWMAHAGTATEMTFPFVLILADGGVFTIAGLVVMLGFHSFISGNMPMGMPVEWNVAMVYGGFFLFGFHAEANLLPLLDAPVLLAFLVTMLFVIPLYGNFVPRNVSFLMSMRYYAGNWAYNVWFFRGDSQKKLDRVVKAAPIMSEQLRKMKLDDEAIETATMLTPAFRLMHLQGRVLHGLLPRALPNVDEYEWVEGEVVAGLVLGWNFGDGHLNSTQLLEAVQAQCGFEEGELRVVMVESQPLAGPNMAWKIVDAATGLLEEGETRVADLLEMQPWPTGELADAYRAKPGS